MFRKASTLRRAGDQSVVKYPILIFWSDEDGEYVAKAPDLEGCTSTGETPEEATREIQIARHLWLEVARESGYLISSRQPTLARAS